MFQMDDLREKGRGGQGTVAEGVVHSAEAELQNSQHYVAWCIALQSLWILDIRFIE